MRAPTTTLAAAVLLVCFSTFAHGQNLFVNDGESVPYSVAQQRSLLQASPPPVTYAVVPNTKTTGTIYLLINPPLDTILDARKYGLAHFNARIKPTLRKFNAVYPGAHLNFRATYISGPLIIIGPGQGWLTYSFTVDLGPPGASYAGALRSELRSALRRRSKYVKRTCGNIPKA